MRLLDEFGDSRYLDACPSFDCHPGDHEATAPLRTYDDRGRWIAEYQCTRGHKWVTWWTRLAVPDIGAFPVERDLVIVFPSERDVSAEVAALEAALSPGSAA